MATDELLPLRRRLQVAIALFIAFYILGIIFVGSFGYWQYIVCSLTMRWILELVFPLLLDVPMILVIVYLHHRTYKDEKLQYSTPVTQENKNHASLTNRPFSERLSNPGDKKANSESVVTEEFSEEFLSDFDVYSAQNCEFRYYVSRMKSNRYSELEESYCATFIPAE
jgi:hypothetical protein